MVEDCEDINTNFALGSGYLKRTKMDSVAKATYPWRMAI
jgi:hypothetical protein